MVRVSRCGVCSGGTCHHAVYRSEPMAREVQVVKMRVGFVVGCIAGCSGLVLVVSLGVIRGEGGKQGKGTGKGR